MEHMNCMHDESFTNPLDFFYIARLEFKYNG